MKLKFYTFIFLALSIGTLKAQTVSTILTQPGAQFEGITWGENGRIYALDFVTGEIYRITTTGDIRTVGTFNGALGGTIDIAGNYYFSEFNTGNIIKIDTAENASVYAEGLIGPAGILIDETNQIMYVSNYTGNRISKIDMLAENPVPTTLASDGLINGPDGLVFSPEGDLISCNFNDNNIQRITPKGEVTKFTTLTGSQNSGYIVRRGDEYIVPGAYTAYIYSISLDGTVRKFAGTGTAGYTDGTVAAAQFSFPNGIAISPTGDTLLITESTTDGRIRMVTDLEVISQILWPAIDSPIKISPNPSSDWLTIQFTLNEAQQLKIDLLDVNSAMLNTLYQAKQVSGVFQERIALPSHLQSGTYFIRIRAGDKVYYSPIAVHK